MRICLVYDCLFPWTVGGAERWMRGLGERLAADGHRVTYLTLRQWERGERPDVPGVEVVAVGPGLALYGADGNRRVLPPLVFGLGVLWHLLHHARSYDVVHTASFPYFSLLAAGLLRPLGRYRLVVDWHEVWTLAYWQEYLGPAGGRVGHLVQRLCARLPQRAFCFARLTARRLAEERVNGPVTVLEGEYAGTERPADAPRPARPVVVFAGRHIPEKRVPALVAAMARLRGSGLRAEVFGDGPERGRVEADVAALGVGDLVDVRGFVASEDVDAALRSALCMVLPSRREGYGMVVVEAALRGTPSVVVAGEDNAAVELVEDGVNGVVAPSSAPEDLAAAILRVRDAGPALRASTLAWYRANERRLSLGGSLDAVTQAYARLPSARA